MNDIFKLTKRQKENTQIYWIRNNKGDIKTYTKEIQRTIRIYFKNMYFIKLENPKVEKVFFLEDTTF